MGGRDDHDRRRRDRTGDTRRTTRRPRPDAGRPRALGLRGWGAGHAPLRATRRPGEPKGATVAASIVHRPGGMPDWIFSGWARDHPGLDVLAPDGGHVARHAHVGQAAPEAGHGVDVASDRAGRLVAASRWRRREAVAASMVRFRDSAEVEARNTALMRRKVELPNHALCEQLCVKPLPSQTLRLSVNTRP